MYNHQDFLKSILLRHKQALLDYCASKGVDVRDYPEHELMLLDYNQLEAVDNDQFSDNCRGLLIDYDGNIVRRGFLRFYNMGQAGWTEFDFKNSIIAEKADGSLGFVYFCKSTKQWELGTRGTAFAEGNNEWHSTFRNLFLNCIDCTEEQFQEDCNKSLNKEYTYLFEMVGPSNRIVTPYINNHAVFLSCFDNATGEECLVYFQDDFTKVVNWNVRPVKLYKFNTKEDCLESLKNLPTLAEGYVCYNPKTKERIKIKSPQYLATHRLRGNGLTTNAVCELIVMNEWEEYLATFTEDAHKFTDALATWELMQDTLHLHYETYKNIEGQKEFALKVKDLPLSCIMFSARKNKSHVLHELNLIAVSKKAEWLKENLK